VSQQGTLLLIRVKRSSVRMQLSPMVDVSGGPSSGLRKRKSFRGGKYEAAKLRWPGGGGGAQLPVVLFKSPKRRVRAAHGRARAAITH
jgi:hypothetical protein